MEVWALFVIFWVLLYIARDDLGRGGVTAAVGVWAVLLIGMLLADRDAAVLQYVLLAGQAMLDGLLLVIYFRGNVRIR